ncbi:TlpA family protein disulfide reductase [Plasticicumulans acidivorans]|uniref:TlpA family protein disulfide reductase n=1 Tax=Plasticicumulans acidivorans TaxID=886464 RepID=UPI000D70FC39|nr:TlpA disulfide reductase family protein [Plasticicumulans acidivorans]
MVLHRLGLTLLLAVWGQIAIAEPIDIKLPGVDGSEFSLASQRGKWVVLNVWATWCGPCVEELPELEAFNELHKDRDAVVIGVNYESISRTDLQQFVSRAGISYTVVMADAKPIPGLPRLKGVPTTFIVTPDGELARTYIGPVTAAGIELLINDLRGTSTGG